MLTSSYSAPASSSAMRTANDALPVIWKNSIMPPRPSRRSLPLRPQPSGRCTPPASGREQLREHLPERAQACLEIVLRQSAVAEHDAVLRPAALVVAGCERIQLDRAGAAPLRPDARSPDRPRATRAASRCRPRSRPARAPARVARAGRARGHDGPGSARACGAHAARSHPSGASRRARSARAPRRGRPRRCAGSRRCRAAAAGTTIHARRSPGAIVLLAVPP